MNRDHIKSNEMEWEDSDGILEKEITGDNDGVHMLLLKLSPGQDIPLHKHVDTRCSYVLEGSISDKRGNYSKGDLFITRTGTSHAMKAGPNGCEFLVVWK